MRSKSGTTLLFGGLLCLTASFCLILWNFLEDRQASIMVEEILPRIEKQMETENSKTYDDITDDHETVSVQSQLNNEMTEIDIDGYLYIGYISIPSLGLELPVMSSWSYPQLKIAPCRYYGSTKTRDLVIAAHNYSRHFGNIKSLNTGDSVYFTDIDEVVTVYQVAEIDTLGSNAVEEMTSSGYELTLFTCTYDGQSRVTVRCSVVE